MVKAYSDASVRDSDATLVEQLEKTFKAADKNSSGDLDYDEFQQALADYKFKTNPYKLKQLFDKFDADGSGTITIKEFLTFLDPPKDGKAPVVVEDEKEATYDPKSKDSEPAVVIEDDVDEVDEGQERKWRATPLTPEERQAALTAACFGSDGGKKMVKEQLGQIFVKYDKDRSGELDKKELALVFADMMGMVLTNDTAMQAEEKQAFESELKRTSQKAAAATFAAVDADGSGTVSMKEFVAYVSSDGFVESIGKAMGGGVKKVQAAAKVQKQKSKIREMLFSKGGFCMDPEDLGIIFNKVRR
jgi:Ca2+-binding EF-hand superfamily protein